MGKLGLLLKVQAQGLFGINRLLHEDDRSGRLRLVVVAAAVVAVAAFMGFYGYKVAQSLVLVGAANAIPVLAVALGGLAGVGVAFLKANGQLFGFSDFDLVMSMPVPTWQIVVSRLASLYGMNLLFALVLMGPMLGVYGVAAGIGWASWCVVVVLVVLAPALPMAVAVVIAYAIAALATRMRYAKVAMGLLTLVLAVGIVVGIMAVSGRPTISQSTLPAEELGRLGDLLSSMVGSFYPPALWGGRGLVEGSLPLLGLFVLVSVVPMAAVVALMSHWFLAINAGLMLGETSGRVRARVLRPQSPFAAMVGKELRLIVNTPIYLTNTAVGPLLAIAAAVGLVVAGPQVLASGLQGDVPASVQATIERLATMLIPWLLGLCVAISSTSASSVSLEGSARWVMQTIPVSVATIVGAKAAANLVLSVPACLLAAVIVAVGLQQDLLQTAVLLAVPLSGALFASCCGVWLDVRKPRYDWTTPYEVVKRSVAVVITLFAGMLLMIGGGALSVWVADSGGFLGLSPEVVSLGWGIAVALLSVVLLRSASRVSLQDS